MNTRSHSMLSRLGLISLRQRYLAAMLIVSLLLTIIAYFGWQYVRTTNQEQLDQIQHRAEASDAIADVADQIHIIEINLLRYITLPSEANKIRINRAYQLYDAATSKLLDNKWVIGDKSLVDLIQAMVLDRRRLNTITDELLKVRSDEAKWFPAMTIMQDRMLQHNLQFMAALDFMINDINEDLRNPNKLEIYKLLNDIRHSWDMMVSEFRLFVSNSFGVFANDPALGMQTRRSNIEIYSKRLDTLLNRLQQKDHVSQLDVLNRRSVTEMRQAFMSWKQAYTEVTNSFQQDVWRNDLLMLHKQVEPLLDKIQQRASSLQLELGVASAKDITHLTGVAKNLSDSVVYIAIGLSLIGLLGYIFFHRVILLPIATVARALKSEALSEKSEHGNLHLSEAKEIRDLTNAFDEMREQIYKRQSHLDYLAHHDALTALPNRTLLRDRLGQAIARARRDNKMVGLMFLDLDRFKQINDTLGHDVGDHLLRFVATRLAGCIRATDTVARLGGDEFGIVVENIGHADQIAVMAGKILNSFTAPFLIKHHELHTTTSIGIALGPNDDNDVESLIKDADLAMYHAKEQGRNNFKFYSVEMAAQVEHHMVLETQLRQAMDNHEFILHYQPIVSLQTGQIIYTEALLRWQHPQRGLLSPMDFLPVLEDSGLIRPLTQWVVNQASLQYLRQNQAGFGQIRMAVNLSGLLLRNDVILDIVINTIEQTRIDPTGLLVEFTEDTLLEAMQDSKKALTSLHAMGVRIALDDFGTGQSSLSHLRRNPIDIVKIDRDFIRDIPGNQHDCELVDAIIAMAHKLHIKVVAEGVETQEQLEFLRWHKCDAIQGYYFSSAVDGDSLLELLLKNQRLPLIGSGH